MTVSSFKKADSTFVWFFFSFFSFLLITTSLPNALNSVLLDSNEFQRLKNLFKLAIAKDLGIVTSY